MQEHEELITVRQAAELLGVVVPMVYRYMNKGLLERGVEIAGKVFARRIEVEALKEQREQGKEQK